MEELDRVVAHMMNGRIIRHLLTLYNRMLREGSFLLVWQKGMVKIFMKSKDKNPSEVKSHRQVKLLSVLGKVGEKLMSRE